MSEDLLEKIEAVLDDKFEVAVVLPGECFDDVDGGRLLRGCLSR